MNKNRNLVIKSHAIKEMEKIYHILRQNGLIQAVGSHFQN